MLFWSGGRAPAQTPPQPPLLPIDILELARQRVLLLPEIPTDSSPPQPVTWDWREVPTGDGRILDFVPSSWSQQGGTCYLFATIGAAEVVVAELNLGQYRREVERLAPDHEVVGAHRVDGELLSPEEILEKGGLRR